MKGSSGRIGQYRILNSEESISKHLFETELLTEVSLIAFLERYHSVVIKPVFGPGEIYVSSDQNQVKITSKLSPAKVLDKEAFYQYLERYEFKQKYYLIQPDKHNTPYFQNRYHYFITVHRNSPLAQWCFSHKTEKYSSLFGRLIYMSLQQRFESLAILAATKLGESFPDCQTIVVEVSYGLGGIWIQDTILHFPKSKWHQHHSLSTNSTITSFLPETDILTKVTFCDFLNKYREIIIKPCNGKEGLGIVKIITSDFFTYEIQSGRKKFMKSTIEETYNFIEEKFLTKKYYLVQQKVPLTTISDCPIDVRVIIQKVNSVWKVTAMMVKVASKGFFITNAAQKLLSLEDALQESNANQLKPGDLDTKVSAICIIAAQHLEANNPEIDIIGFDIGITSSGAIWIIEGNLNPNLSMFYKQEDKELYMNILKSKCKTVASATTPKEEKPKDIN